MKLVRGLDAWQCCRDTAYVATVATIGNFDGVHLGHAAMLAQLVAAGRERGLPAVVTSFTPLPHEHFAREAQPPRLHGLRDRVAAIGATDVDALLLLRFDDTLASLDADDFVQRILVDTLHVQHLVIGDDFRFGRGRGGDFDTLVDAGVRHGFTVARTATVADAAQRVSSTRVRAALADRALDDAAALLGRPYRISGRVVHGEKVGRQLGFPTANIALRNLRPPLAGVFAVHAHDLDTGIVHRAVANLGERPTVGGRKLLLEVNVLHGSPELYGHHLAVDFLHFIRGEQRFASLDELKAQIGKDALIARKWLDDNTPDA